MQRIAALLLYSSAIYAAYVSAAGFVVEQSNVIIRVPGQAAEQSFDAAIGDFGVPKYGAILSGSVYFNSENSQGCSEHFPTLPSSPNNISILLVERGSCYFVEKAWHAQNIAHASAILVADNVHESLVTMAAPETLTSLASLVEKITIPTLLISKNAGDAIKSLIQQYPNQVIAELNWLSSIKNPDQLVEWELWLTSNQACGPLCTEQQHFLQQFKPLAMSFEQQNYTSFTPHVMLQHCYYDSPSCDQECINNRRYCAVEPIPEQHRGLYNGADVVTMNARHLCAFKAAKDSGQSWQWWVYASGFAVNCTMDATRFDVECAHEHLNSAGIEPGVVEACVGDPANDAPHPVLEDQLYAQRDQGNTGRGAVIMLPTVVINRDQYRGTLTIGGVLRALCAGFAEGTEPPQCLVGGLERDECMMNTHDCWMHEQWTACVDTYRGFICRCPLGWEGDGHTCTDIDECALGIHGCDEICVNEPGTYHCECSTGKTLLGGHGEPGICVPNSLGRLSSQTHLPAWLIVLLLCAMAMLVSAASVAWYRQRMRNDMYGEIRAIMREYIPLDSTGDDEEGGDGDGVGSANTNNRSKKFVGRFLGGGIGGRPGVRAGGGASDIEERLVGRPQQWSISTAVHGGGDATVGGTEMVGGRKM